MRYSDLALQQKRSLDHKIGVATQIIHEALQIARCPALAFSGGKDSTVLLHLVRQHKADIPVIYGNTGVEFLECVKFTHWLAREWNLNLHEARPGKTDRPGFKYAGQRRIWERLIAEGKIGEVLKADGKLSSTLALEQACPSDLRMQLEAERLIWPEGSLMSYWWCVDQYGWPLLGKSWSRLTARRINIDTFLHFSDSQSDDAKLLAYYGILRQVKVSQACCDVIKKEPSERVQAELGVDLIFKGLMASESRARMKNFCSRGYTFVGARRRYLGDKPFWHSQPMAIWTDEDVWAYISRFNLPYAPLYDMGYTDRQGSFHRIRRNGCMGCATDLLFPNNHMSMLRRTHPKAWETFMRRGMAAEIQKLQQARRGYPTLFDLFTPEELLERRPCIFDDLSGLNLDDDTAGTDDIGFDPEV